MYTDKFKSQKLICSSVFAAAVFFVFIQMTTAIDILVTPTLTQNPPVNELRPVVTLSVSPGDYPAVQSLLDDDPVDVDWEVTSDSPMTFLFDGEYTLKGYEYVDEKTVAITAERVLTSSTHLQGSGCANVSVPGTSDTDNQTALEKSVSGTCSFKDGGVYLDPQTNFGGNELPQDNVYSISGSQFDQTFQNLSPSKQATASVLNGGLLLVFDEPWRFTRITSSNVTLTGGTSTGGDISIVGGSPGDKTTVGSPQNATFSGSTTVSLGDDLYTYEYTPSGGDTEYRLLIRAGQSNTLLQEMKLGGEPDPVPSVIDIKIQPTGDLTPGVYSFSYASSPVAQWLPYYYTYSSALTYTVAKENIPTDLSVSNANLSNGKYYYNQDTQTITGNGLAGETVTVLDGTTELGTATVGSDDSWSFNTSFSTEGEYSISAFSTGSDGIASNPSTSITLVIDKATIAPAVTFANDTGTSDIDNITSNGTLNIGDIEVGATWEYSIDGGSYVTGTGTTIPDSTFTSDGSISVVVRQTDLAGNTSSDSSFTFTLDTEAPSITLTSSDKLFPGEISLVGVDFINKAVADGDDFDIVTVAPSTPVSGVTYKYAIAGPFGLSDYFNGQRLSGVTEAVVCPTDLSSYGASNIKKSDITSKTDNKYYGVCVRAEDTAGNSTADQFNFGYFTVYAKANYVSYIIDRDTLVSSGSIKYLNKAIFDTNPSKIILNIPIQDDNFNSGADYKQKQSLTTQSIDCASIDSSNYSTTLIKTNDERLTDGDHRVCVRIVDYTGNESFLSSDFTVDRTPPLLPTIGLATSSDTSRDGLTGGDSDNYTQDLTNLSFAGCTEVGSTIRVSVWSDTAIPISTPATVSDRGCTDVTDGKEYTISIPSTDFSSSESGTSNYIYASAVDGVGNASGDTITSSENIFTDKSNYASCKISGAGSSSSDCSSSGSVYPDVDSGVSQDRSGYYVSRDLLFEVSFDKTYVITSVTQGTATNITITIGGRSYTSGTSDFPLTLDKNQVFTVQKVNDAPVDLRVNGHELIDGHNVTIDSGVETTPTPVISLQAGDNVSGNRTSDTTPTFTISNVEKDSVVSTYVWVDTNTDTVVDSSELTLRSEVLSGITDGSITVTFDGTEYITDYEDISGETIDSTVLTEGTHKIRFIIEDKAGNKSTYSGSDFVVDLTGPSGYSFDITGDDALDILVNTANVANYTIRIDGVETGVDPSSSNIIATDSNLDDHEFDLADATVASGTITKSINLIPASDGPLSFRVKLSDNIGNAGVFVSTPTLYVITKDTSAPSVTEETPVPTRTNDTTPDYTFNTTEGGTITYGGSCSSSKTTANSGDNTITFNALTEGTYSNCQITITDTAGNTSNTQIVTSFTLDTSAPSVPTISLATDTGSSDSDKITNNGTLTIGDIETRATWEYSVGGGSYVTGTGTTIPSSKFTSNGSTTVTVRQTDVAGNTSNSSSAFIFTLDTSSPSVTEETPVPTRTNDTTPDYTFNTTEGGTITYGGSCSSSKTTANSGDNTITFNALTEGTYSNCQITITDTAGNTSNTQSVTSFTIDTTAPSIPTVSLATDTGSSDSDKITNNGEITVEGLETTGTWEYTLDDGTTWNTGTGTVVPASGFSANTSNTIKVRQTDVVGNTGDVSSEFTFTLDTSAPSIPTPALANDTGIDGSDLITKDGTLNIEGIETGATWRYSIDGGSFVTGTGTTIPDGTFTSDGDIRVAIKQTDSAGNTSSDVSLTFMRDTEAPTITLTRSTELVEGKSTLDGIHFINKAVAIGDDFDIVTVPPVSGVTYKHAMVGPFVVTSTSNNPNLPVVNTAVVCPTDSSSYGTGNIRKSDIISETDNGYYGVCVKAEDTAGNSTVDQSNLGYFTTTFEAQHVAVDDVTNLLLVDSIKYLNKKVSDREPPTTIYDVDVSFRNNISDYGLSPHQVRQVLTGRGTDCDSATLSSKYSTTLIKTDNAGLTDGDHRICARAIDYIENEKFYTLDFIVDRTPPAVTEETPVPTRTNDTTPDHTFNTAEWGTITYGGSCSSSTTTATLGDNTITFNALTEGTHSNCQITITDTAGNTSNTQDVTSFTIDTTSPTITAEVQDLSGKLKNPKYVFNSNEKGTPSFVGDCTSTDTDVSVGDNTITLSTLQVRGYSDCGVQITDLAGNLSNTLSIPTFSIQSSGGVSLPGRGRGSRGGSSFKAPRLPTPTTPTVQQTQQIILTYSIPTISRGQRSQEVLNLQKALNQKGHTVSQTGAGSMGQETNYFGPATESALRRYQEANDLTMTGTLNQETRESFGPQTPEQSTQQKQMIMQKLTVMIEELIQRINTLMIQRINTLRQQESRQKGRRQGERKTRVVPSQTTNTQTTNTQTTGTHTSETETYRFFRPPSL